MTQKPSLQSFARFATLRTGSLLLVLILALLIVSFFSPQYLSPDNLLVVLLQVSFVGIAAIGTAYLIMAGSVDLSIGSQYSLCAVAAAMLARTLPSPLAWTCGILLGGFLGLINGMLVWRIPISPIIVTLGTLTIYRGIAFRITNGFGVRGVPASFTAFGRARLLDIPSPVWILVLFAVLAHCVLRFTKQGRHLLAFGGSHEAAEAAGIDGKWLLIVSFVINGALVATSAVLAASRFGSAAPTFGTGFELDVIAAVILGGVAFTGGEGSIAGVLLAVLLLGVINSGLIAMGCDPHYAQIVKGAALVAAVALDQFAKWQQERRRKRLALHERATAT